MTRPLHLDGVPLARIGVVGSGPVADRLAASLAHHGADVVALSADAGGSDPGALRDVQLVIVGGPDTPADTRRGIALAGRFAAPAVPVVTTSVHTPYAALAGLLDRPERLVVARLGEPRIGRVVELVEGGADARVSDAVAGVFKQLGHTVLRVRETGGLVVDSLVLAMLDRAAGVVERGEATAAELDDAMRLGCGLPEGPLRMLDGIGLDVALASLTDLYARRGPAAPAPTLLLRRMAAAGFTGEGGGRGFHHYSEGRPQETPGRATSAEHVVRPVRRVGVVGAGTMAAGIAEVFLLGGHSVRLVGRSSRRAADAIGAVREGLRQRRIADQEAEAYLSRCEGTADLADLADCDLVVEAVAEDLTVKRELLARLGRVCRPGAVLATTTSSLPVIECAMATGRAADVIGLHFFNPAPAMALVEVVPTLRTAADVRATALELCRRLGKHPVVCPDRTGFLVNALLFPYLNDALRLVQDGVVEPAALDTAMRSGCGFAIGPLRLVDVVGADVAQAVLRRLHDELGGAALAPVRLLDELVAAGDLGQKAGRGVRDHVRRRSHVPSVAGRAA
ncbi:3-hydroxyacyl-CoA dehydrogenase NAD-binding domain-containing protein [Krasilnikovia sp. M28-CT-15]|uniref:3-hydroxyacyl-CoA dehydrogenase NAD-binding domain-containing protein n=1 Tax=Krasilnikovia sp. M28-CT-15 TaxID=3373540 RepID=UPI003875F2EC